MRCATAVLVSLAFASSAHAEVKQADERFFDAFLPVMIGVGVLIVVFVVGANIVVARRRYRSMPPSFVPTVGMGYPMGTPSGVPHTVSKTTTTTSADGSVTVTVIEETTGGATFGGVNGVVDPELFMRVGTSGELQQEILTEVRDAFRRMGGKPNDPQV